MYSIKQSQRRKAQTKITVRIGNAEFNVMNLNFSPEGDMYIFPPIKKAGLHLSLHQSGHVHIKDKFGYHEDIDFFNEKMINEGVLSDIRKMRYQPEHNEDVLVVPIPKCLPNVIPENSLPRRIDIDTLGILDEVLTQNICVVNAERIWEATRFLGTDTSLVLDQEEEKIAILDNPNEFAISFELHDNAGLKMFEKTIVGKLLLPPIQKLIARIEQLESDGKIDLSSWLPKDIDETSIGEKINKVMKNFKLKRL